MATPYTQYHQGYLDSEGYETDYECEFDEEEKEHCFMLRTNDAILDKAFRRHFKQSLPRKEGHYKLQTRVRKVHDEENVDRFYSGHHWEVDGRYHSGSDLDEQPGDEFNNRPLQLERTTCKLTVLAVQDAMGAEQRRRKRKQSQLADRAKDALKPLHNELEAIINRNEERLKQERKESVREMGDVKDDVMIELIRQYNDQILEEDVESERQRRLEQYDQLTESDDINDENRERLKSLAFVSSLWQDMQCELTGAFNDLDEVHTEEDNAVNGLFLELKDEFIRSFQRATHLMKLHMTEEKERRRSLSEARSIAAGQKDMDTTRKKAMLAKTAVDEELNRLFAGVKKDDSFGTGVGQGQASRDMDQTLEGLVHKVHARDVDQACAEERIVRLAEIAEEMEFGTMDSMKEALKDAMVLIQEQMLLSKFHGHKVQTTVTKTSGRQVSQEGETEQDKKLRTARLKSRRQSCVVTDF
ncbi:hypothetical protein HOLleu_20707 [Holothuria leucospilota]|uniref:Uncharacterized protein n=1 Tax=Holothuria leucospilota TaxID=206669 RepID=A0A9Q1C207_HOLLE|nr:hypothetical protein HOLleu_20707 [Holothuria leucospilota]